jgi:hypothetical protein
LHHQELWHNQNRFLFPRVLLYDLLKFEHIELKESILGVPFCAIKFWLKNIFCIWHKKSGYPLQVLARSSLWAFRYYPSRKKKTLLFKEICVMPI